MKSVQFTLTITGRVPGDIDIDSLFLNLNLPEVQVGYFNSCGEPIAVEAKLEEYETVNAEALDDPEEMPLDAEHDLPEDDLPRDTVPYSDEGP